MKLQSLAVTFLAGLVVVGSCKLACAQRTERVSIDSSGVEGNGSIGSVAISANGRFVAFSSAADNLVAGDGNGVQDVFVHDRMTGTTDRVSVDSSGVEGDGASDYPAISADGRFVSFESDATNLVAGDVNGVTDIFVHDRLTGTTELVSVDSLGNQGDDVSNTAAISADGRCVAFASFATNLVAGDTNSAADIFVHDRQTGTTERVSVDSLGAEVTGDSYVPSISADGQFVAFASFASALIPSDANAALDIFVHDRSTGTTERVSVDSADGEADSHSFFPSISNDGRFVAFESLATNLVASDTNGVADVFVHDRQTGSTEAVSVSTAGTPGNDQSFLPSISADGRYVAFTSAASNLAAGDTNGALDIFVHDRQKGTTKRVSVDSTGVEGNADSYVNSISADGRFVAFLSFADNLAAGDTNSESDVFVNGPYLTLEIDPPDPLPGAFLTFNTWTGAANSLSLLVVTGINGNPFFLPVVPGSFDATGRWTLGGPVPTGLTGAVITFETLGFIPTGKVDLSAPCRVAFQ